MREAMSWTYRSSDGVEFGQVKRFETAPHSGIGKSSKQIVPYFNLGCGKGIPKSLLPSHRIFGLDSIKDFAQPIFIVEGEKCACALQGLGFQAVTSLGGTGQMHLADWSPINEAQVIYIWPDFDEAGAKYGAHVFRQLGSFHHLKDVKLVPFRSQKKADCCDFLKSLPELANWDEFSNLADHPHQEAITGALTAYIEVNAEPVPAEWHFIVTSHKHKLISANDFSQIKLPARPKLLAPWLVEGSINMVFADRGIGKTFFCLSCAAALANGKSFLCFEAPGPVPVLYLDGEMPATAMQWRLKMLTNGERTNAPLHIYTPDCQDLTDHIPDLGTSGGRAEVNELIDAVRPKAVFIDNISTFVRTGNENEGDSWAPIQAWAVQLRKRGIAVIFVHHANKEGKQRGTHKKEDVMDVVIQLKRPDEFIQGTDDTRIMIRYSKARHLPAIDTQDIEATLKTSEEGLEWTWEAGDLAYQRVVQLLSENVSMGDIADELEVSKSTVHRWKKRAIEQNLLQ